MGLLCMSFGRRIFYTSLRSTALCSIALACFLPLTTHAFDPNEGASKSSSSKARPRLPSTAPLIAPMPRLTFSSVEDTSAKPESPRPKLVFPEVVSVPQTPIENPAPVAVAAAPALPSLPPVDAVVEQRARQEIAALPPALIEPATSSARVAALTPSAAGAIEVAEVAPEKLAETPIAPIPPTLSALPKDEPAIAESLLSDDSKKILSGLPSKLDEKHPPKGGKLAISRARQEAYPLVQNPKVESFDSGGLSIKVQRPGLDANFELNRAYTSLMGGESSVAIDTYKNILSSEPSNEDALFGLASTYHRLGDIEHARPYYATLLKLNPNHRDGLNNFLALISDESPQEALAELERLEQRNPDFSPIPAQQAVLLERLGYVDKARDKILRAIELAPANLTYKYNLAIMMDKTGNYAEASALYRLLIDAALNGEKIPAPAASLQKRLNYIAAIRANTAPIGS